MDLWYKTSCCKNLNSYHPWFINSSQIWLCDTDMISSDFVLQTQWFLKLLSYSMFFWDTGSALSGNLWILLSFNNEPWALPTGQPTIESIYKLKYHQTSYSLQWWQACPLDVNLSPWTKSQFQNLWFCPFCPGIICTGRPAWILLQVPQQKVCWVQPSTAAVLHCLLDDGVEIYSIYSKKSNLIYSIEYWQYV